MRDVNEHQGGYGAKEDSRLPRAKGEQSRRLEDETVLRRHVLALETERHDQHRMICWRFTSGDARIELQDLYPVKETSSTD